MLVALIGMSALGTQSCNSEEVYEEPVAQEDTSNEDADVAVTDVNAPCDFSLADLEPNSTVVINCILDLQGETFNLPDNVTLLAEGGDIINGTLHFSEGSSIDGELLGSTLNVTGTNPALRDTAFAFDPKRWGIVEGVVSDEVARSNRDIFEETMLLAKEYGIDTFKIDEMDAYFKTDEPTGHPVPALGAINVPSDFHLLMTDNTHVRMQPNAYKRPSLLATYNVSNVIIEGGNLHGDRDTHDYSDGGTHEWVHTLRIEGTTNLTVKNVKSFDAGGDGISIGSVGHAYDSHYSPTNNLLITGCSISRNRRNGISIGDGRDIIIENNEFIDNGVDTALSKGTAPRMAIDIEAQNGGGIVYQIAKDIKIINNTETGAASFSFYIAHGYDVIIEDNSAQGSIGFHESHNSIIRNNIITATSSGQKERGVGLQAGVSITEYGNYNNKIYGNTIIDYATGLDIVNFDNEVYSNKIINCGTGIAINQLKDSFIYDNIIESNIDRSLGIITKASTLTINNVIIENNIIDVVLSAFKMTTINQDLENKDNTFKIIGNDTKSEGTSGFSYMSGMDFSNNKNEGGLRLVGVQNSSFSGNTIITDGARGIDLSSENDNIEAYNNVVTINGTSECIRDKQDNTNLKIYNNTCNE